MYFQPPNFNQQRTPGVNNNMRQPLNPTSPYGGGGGFDQHGRPMFYPVKNRQGQTNWMRYNYAQPQGGTDSWGKINPGGVPDIQSGQTSQFQVPVDQQGNPVGSKYPSIQTGIGVTPVPQQQIQQGMHWLSSAQPGVQGQGLAGGAGQMLSDAMQTMGNSAATQFARTAVPQNQQYQLAAEQARANAGLGWGGLQNQQLGQDLQRQNQVQNALLQLLGLFS